VVSAIGRLQAELNLRGLDARLKLDGGALWVVARQGVLAKARPQANHGRLPPGGLKLVIAAQAFQGVGATRSQENVMTLTALQ
jgi:hypothetical protein